MEHIVKKMATARIPTFHCSKSEISISGKDKSKRHSLPTEVKW
jgi:hypothetical protein